LTRLVEKAKPISVIRTLALGACLASCGRSSGIPDKDLGGLVVATKTEEAPIDVDRAAKDPAELGRALMRPYRTVVAALGSHTVVIATGLVDAQSGKPDEQLTDQTKLELGEGGTYHAVVTNSADYGRETTFTGGAMYLRPRYQRWHKRAPETPDEPATARDQYAEAMAATWDLLAPGAELTDLGPVQIAGRAGRKIAVKLTPAPRPAGPESLVQRKWREQRTVGALTGEIVLDADKGVPLVVKLDGTVSYLREGHPHTLAASVHSEVSAVGPVAIAVPADDDVVATPERLREVDDRDYLLQGIAPPLRKNADGTAVPPQQKPAPVVPAPAPAPPKPKPKDTKG
jgi:hypothetical protein